MEHEIDEYVKVNKIKNLTKEELEDLIEKSNGLHDLMREIEIPLTSFYLQILKETMEKYDLKDTKYKLLFSNNDQVRGIMDFLVEQSSPNMIHLLKKLYNLGLIMNKCYMCGIDPEWRGRKLVLQYDHINGNHNDNRIENLRLLCPNCHDQRGHKRRIKKPYI